MVAVTVHVPAVDDVNEPPDSAQLDAVPFTTAYVTAPAVVPPDVPRVIALPYVPGFALVVTDSAVWFAFVTVTVPLAAVNE
jgi:hypothetical protein